MLKLFDEDRVCEGASEEAITKAILGFWLSIRKWH